MSSELRVGYVYKHTSPSGQSYIGKSMSSLGKRWQDHVLAAYDEKYKEYSYPLQRAIRKYGEDSFNTEVLEDNIPEELLSEAEILYIDKHDTFYSGYNQTKGGEGTSGERSIEAKENIAKANKERVWTEDMKNKMAETKEGIALKPWFIVYPDGTREEVVDMGKAPYALSKGWHVGSFKNLFSITKGVGQVIKAGTFRGFTVGNLGDGYDN